MRHLATILIAFVAAWFVATVGLLGFALIYDLGSGSHPADAIGTVLATSLGYAYFSFLCVGAAWLIVAIPYYLLFMRGSVEGRFWLHAVTAGVLGAVFMRLATLFLPVADSSWRVTVPIAFVVGLMSVVIAKWTANCFSRSQSFRDV